MATTRAANQNKRALSMYQHEVKAILTNGQSRFTRVIIPQPTFLDGGGLDRHWWWDENCGDYYECEDGNRLKDDLLKYCKSKYGKVGDRLLILEIPEWAHSFCLEITGVKIERMQDISIEDMLAEGLESMGWDYAKSSDDSGSMFMYWADQTKEIPADWMTSCECIEDVMQWLWDSVNKIHGWDSNPWVVAYYFKIVKL